MKKPIHYICTFLIASLLFSCQQKKKPVAVENKIDKKEFSISFDSQEEWGEHLVTILDCHACHTPKKMTDKGPVLDNSLLLSGHPAEMPLIDVDRKEMEAKGLTVARDLTEWVGPWGVSFAANLTPDDSGLGNWTEQQFIIAIRDGKSKGISSSRSLLPPMPWDMYRHMTDAELKAIFVYLQSIKPIQNLVPAPLPPVSAGQ